MISAVMPTYGRTDVVFERGEGTYLFDTDGKRYLDFGTGIAVVSIGHAHPHLVAALKDQADKLWHCSNLYRIAGQEKLAQRLVDNSFADTVFFCNSGAEAVEAGLKMVRKYQDSIGNSGKYRVITCEQSFHGRTLATISAGGNDKHREGFGPMVEAFDRVAFGNLNELRGAITDETAAILVEPIQGEGGIHPAEPEYFQRLRETADEFGLALFFDEVQTGVGRTGKFLAHEWTGITPDVVSIAKGLGGGFPVGACLATEKVAAALGPGTHGSTFGGNPLAMAAANAVLDVVLEDGFLDHVIEMGNLLRGELQKLVERHPAVLEEVRGGGLLLGMKAKAPNMEIVNALIAKGLLTVPAGDNVVRFIPPLTVSAGEIADAVALVDEVCGELAP